MNLRSIPKSLEFFRRPEARTFVIICGVWSLLAVLNHLARKQGILPGSPAWFPIAVFSGPEIHLSGLIFGLALLAAFYLAANRVARRPALAVWGIGFLLIILGNFGQCGFSEGFLDPLREAGNQYYHDAIGVESWREWLASFNSQQSSLLAHSRTHPPFAVLLHSFCLWLGGQSLAVLAVLFAAFSSLSILFMCRIMNELDVPVPERNLIALLFAVMPAVNIYSAVSLDGIILTCSIAFLFGLIRVITRKKLEFVAVLAIAGGLISTNLLTFGGVALAGIGCLLAAYEAVTEKRVGPIGWSMMASATLSLAVVIWIDRVFQYDQIEGFLTAAQLENPNGFRGFSEPLVYLATRLGSIGEIALFMSLGCCAALFHRNLLRRNLLNHRDPVMKVMLCGVVTVLLLLLAGAYRTGETARTCLFLIPYLILAFFSAEEKTLRTLGFLAAFQTVGMQVFGNYFW